MEYKPTIGLEMHCESKTDAKMFSSAKNFHTDNPNSNIKALDMAFPGTLPVVNKEAIKKAIMMAMCINCEVPDELVFERKNYFYPDLPTGYQLTQQNYKPIGVNGYLDVEVGEEVKRIYINNIHQEVDTASLDHFFDYSLIDYNRCGVPLLECVTEPCIHSADEAVAFLETMRSIYKYTDISEADTKKGQIRCDVNISVAPADSKELGTRVEIKNVNSFGSVRDAINYEVKRHIDLLKAGKGDEIKQETRRWDDEKSITTVMRSKEDAIDYKYFLEPNIPKIKLAKEWLDEIRNSIPMLPLERKELYIEKYALSAYDAGVIVKEKEIADYFEKCLELKIDPKAASNWITSMIMGYLNKNDQTINEFYLTPERLSVILDAINNNKISSKQAKELFYLVLEEQDEPATLMKKHGMEQLDNDDELEAIIKEILANNASQIEEYKNGKTNMFDYFVGQTMKATKGKANPVKVKDILTSELSK